MEARVLWVFHQADRPITYAEAGRRAGCATHSVKVYVCRLRSALDSPAFDRLICDNSIPANQTKVRLLPPGREEITEALRMMLAELSDVVTLKAQAA